MRSFHTSGSANLDVDPKSKIFLEHYLKDIIIDNDNTILILDENYKDLPESLTQINGFINQDNNKLIYSKHDEDVLNKDAVSIMLKAKDLLKSQKLPDKTPSEFYSEMMTCLLEVGNPYSSYVEILFANMFLTDEENTKFWRYNQNDKIVSKLGDKVLAQNISPLLGVLYQPNKKSLATISEFDEIDLDYDNLNIYEKIWLGFLD